MVALDAFAVFAIACILTQLGFLIHHLIKHGNGAHP